MATAYDQIIDEGQRIKGTLQLAAGQSKIWTDTDDFSFRPNIDGRVSANHKAFVPFKRGNDYKIKTGQTYIFDRTVQLTIHYPPSVYNYNPEEEIKKQIIDPSNRLSGSQFIKAGEVVVWEHSEYYNFSPTEPCRLSVGNNPFIQLTGGELILIRHDFDYIFDRDMLLEVGFPPEFFEYPGIYSGGVPIGSIVMYSGAFIDIPENWKLCDGNNGTPDLTNQFIMGALLEDDIGDTGGSADAVVVDHGHSDNFSVEHGQFDIRSSHLPESGLFSNTVIRTHGSFRKVWSTITGYYSLEAASDAGQEAIQEIYNEPEIYGSVSSTGVSGSGKNNPAYYKLAFIRRMS